MHNLSYYLLQCNIYCWPKGDSSTKKMVVINVWLNATQYLSETILVSRKVLTQVKLQVLRLQIFVNHVFCMVHKIIHSMVRLKCCLMWKATYRIAGNYRNIRKRRFFWNLKLYWEVWQNHLLIITCLMALYRYFKRADTFAESHLPRSSVQLIDICDYRIRQHSYFGSWQY